MAIGILFGMSAGYGTGMLLAHFMSFAPNLVALRCGEPLNWVFALFFAIGTTTQAYKTYKAAHSDKGKQIEK